jgi:hypothetical protein
MPRLPLPKQTTVDDIVSMIKDAGDGYWELIPLSYKNPPRKIHVQAVTDLKPSGLKLPLTGSVAVNLWQGSEWKIIHVERWIAGESETASDAKASAYKKALRRAAWLLVDRVRWSEEGEINSHV